MSSRWRAPMLAGTTPPSRTQRHRCTSRPHTDRADQQQSRRKRPAALWFVSRRATSPNCIPVRQAEVAEGGLLLWRQNAVVTTGHGHFPLGRAWASIASHKHRFHLKRGRARSQACRLLNYRRDDGGDATTGMVSCISAAPTACPQITGRQRTPAAAEGGETNQW